MNYADIKRIDIANGEGVRVSLFVSGCRHHCKDCFNAEAWNFNYGKEVTEETENKIMEELKPDHIAGLSLLGGEPLEPENQEEVLKIIKRVKSEYPEKNIWCYTGFKLDDDLLNGKFKDNKTTQEILKNIDVLVDGKFEIVNKDIKLKFRGSSNQRVINVPETLKQGKIIKYLE